MRFCCSTGLKNEISFQNTMKLKTAIFLTTKLDSFVKRFFFSFKKFKRLNNEISFHELVFGLQNVFFSPKPFFPILKNKKKSKKTPKTPKKPCFFCFLFNKTKPERRAVFRCDLGQRQWHCLDAHVNATSKRFAFFFFVFFVCFRFSFFVSSSSFVCVSRFSFSRFVFSKSTNSSL